MARWSILDSKVEVGSAVIYLKVAILAVSALMLVMGLRGQDAPTFLRIVQFTWNQDSHVLTWKANRIRPLPNGGTELAEEFDCRLEFEHNELFCRNQRETIPSTVVKHLEDDLSLFMEHLGQMSSPAVWGERAEK